MKWNKEKEQKFQKAWAKLVAKAWSDPAFKKRLLKEPLAVFKEQGIEFPQELNCEITEDTSKVVHLHIPPKPEGNLSETDLKDIAAGSFSTGFGTSRLIGD